MKRKRMRLPNGFGQISEMKGHNLRNKYRVMITVGKTDEGKPIVKSLKPKAYFPTYNEAYKALVEYHSNPYVHNSDMIMSELFDKWVEEYNSSLKSSSSIRTITSAWSYCESIYEMRVVDVRIGHLKACIDSAKTNINSTIRYASDGVKARIKSVFNLMFDYAVEYEIAKENPARKFKLTKNISPDKEAAHISFSDEEMTILWKNVNIKKYVDVILIQCYSGWRPQELGLIKIEDVDLEKWTFKGGMKTDNGKNRIVPIHERIRPIVAKKYNEATELGSEYLINCLDLHNQRSSRMLTYDKYQKRFLKVIHELELNPSHRPHDGRKHFITMAKKYNVNEYAIKYMVGHAILDLTERVYTDRDLNWLIEEMKKIN